MRSPSKKAFEKLMNLGVYFLDFYGKYQGGYSRHYLYGYVPPKGVSISEAFSRMGYKKLWIAALFSS